MLTFPGASTVQVLYAVQIPISLGGNFGLLLAASFSYIGDVSIKNTFFFLSFTLYAANIRAGFREPSVKKLRFPLSGA